jgi:hypothetical protein
MEKEFWLIVSFLGFKGEVLLNLLFETVDLL